MAAYTSGDGAAFPVHPEIEDRDSLGMTMREWFAGMALSGLMANRFPKDEDAAAHAFRLADAMLAEARK